MTNKEAVIVLKEDKELYESDIVSAFDGTPDGELIGALDMAISALEKQIPKKPKNSDRLVCPVCNSKANYGHPYTDYCCHCGQKTDWRETE